MDEMPSFAKKYNDQDTAAIVAYLKTLHRSKDRDPVNRIAASSTSIYTQTRLNGTSGHA
jgi:mono/diheme cytochrome c family protein